MSHGRVVGELAGPSALASAGLSPADLLAGVALAVSLVLYLRRSPVGHPTVLGSVPWVAVGVALHALRGAVDYPPAVAPLLAPPWAYFLVAALGGLTWLLLGTLTPSDRRAARPRYFGAVGAGALLPPTAVLAASGNVTPPELLVAWLAVPFAASLVAYVVILCLGLWLPESVYFAGSIGTVLVFALAVDGIGTALALEFGGGVASPVGLARAADLVLGRPATPLTSVAAVVWLRLALAVAVLGILSAVARRRPRAAAHGLELATVASAFAAANTFLFALGGGAA